MEGATIVLPTSLLQCPVKRQPNLQSSFAEFAERELGINHNNTQNVENGENADKDEQKEDRPFSLSAADLVLDIAAADWIDWSKVELTNSLGTCSFEDSASFRDANGFTARSPFDNDIVEDTAREVETMMLSESIQLERHELSYTGTDSSAIRISAPYHCTLDHLYVLDHVASATDEWKFESGIYDEMIFVTMLNPVSHDTSLSYDETRISFISDVTPYDTIIDETKILFSGGDVGQGKNVSLLANETLHIRQGEMVAAVDIAMHNQNPLEISDKLVSTEDALASTRSASFWQLATTQYKASVDSASIQVPYKRKQNCLSCHFSGNDSSNIENSSLPDSSNSLSSLSSEPKAESECDDSNNILRCSYISETVALHAQIAHVIATTLPADRLPGLLAIIDLKVPTHDDEVEVDFSLLDHYTLQKIAKYVQECLDEIQAPKQLGEKRDLSRYNTPVNIDGTENEIECEQNAGWREEGHKGTGVAERSLVRKKTQLQKKHTRLTKPKSLLISPSSSSSHLLSVLPLSSSTTDLINLRRERSSTKRISKAPPSSRRRRSCRNSPRKKDILIFKDQTCQRDHEQLRPGTFQEVVIGLKRPEGREEDEDVDILE